jgi:2-desacetyl-2-hydroxyethyl bacteriochlorophyllide A dehydrogenase
MFMNIALLRGPRDFALAEEPVPEIEPDEVLVRVAACGVCTSELDMWEGKAGQEIYPRYPGHEVSGVVERAGDQVTSLKKGEPVGVWVTQRGFAEYVAVKAEYCFPAGEIPLDQVLAEPLACAVNTVELANLSLGDDVVIIGAGFMGNLVQMLAGLQGPRHLIVADVRQDALDRALRLGATHVIDPSKEDLPGRVKELTGGRGADASFEVTGAQGPLQMLGEVTRMSGKVVIVGYHQGGMRQIPLAYWNWMAFRILNAHFRDIAVIRRGMQIGMRLLTSRRLSLEGLVSHRFPLSGINRAFETAHEKPEGFVKSTVLFDGV